MAIITLNKDQFSALTEALNYTNYIEIILTQIFTFAIAVISSFFVQHLFRKADDRTRMIKDLHQFNEATIYIGSLNEDVCGYLNEMVFTNNRNEKKLLEEIASCILKSVEKPTSRISLQSIRPFDQIINFPEKIPDIGQYNDVLEIYYRMIPNIEQARAAANERNTLILKFQNLKEPQNIKKIENEISQINQRTGVILVSLEYILDASMHLSERLANIAKTLRTEADKNSIKNTTIFTSNYNQFIDQIRLQARELVNQNPDWRDRVLHMPDHLKQAAD